MPSDPREVNLRERFCRLGLSSLFSSAVLPLIQTIGLGPTNTLAAVVSFLGYLLVQTNYIQFITYTQTQFDPVIRLIAFTIRYGSNLREWKDIGYTVREVGNTEA